MSPPTSLITRKFANLAKLSTSDVSGTTSETYYETNRVDIFATHAGENVSFVQTNYDDSGWRTLNLPHDWAVELPFDPSADGNHGFKPVGNASFGTNSIGWYRRTFTCRRTTGKRIWLKFDGVFRNCRCGSTATPRPQRQRLLRFEDITPSRNFGGTNVLVVRVDAADSKAGFTKARAFTATSGCDENPGGHRAGWGTFVATTIARRVRMPRVTMSNRGDQPNRTSDRRTAVVTVDDLSTPTATRSASVTSPVEAFRPDRAWSATQTVSFAANFGRRKLQNFTSSSRPSAIGTSLRTSTTRRLASAPWPSTRPTAFC